MKEAIVDSSDHTVTLENEHVLAGKKKSLSAKKSTRANPQKKKTSGNMTGGNPTLTQKTTNLSTEVIVTPDSPQKSSPDSSLTGPSSFGSASEPIVATQSRSTIRLRRIVGSSFGSAYEPMLLDSTLEETPPVATQPRSKIRPPAFLC